MIKEIVKLGIEKNNIKNIVYIKRSIDSRKKDNIKIIYNIEVEIHKEIKINNSAITIHEEPISKKRISNNKNGVIVVVGSGPAGLFASLKLIEYGYKPLIIERGSNVDERDVDIEKFVTEKILDENSNIQFGEGGAGTYSDGKLTTRVKTGYNKYVFDKLVEFGAPKEILYDFKPHIGTDILKVVIKNIRNYLLNNGGEIYFNTKLVDISITNDKIKSIELENVENSSNNIIDVDYLLLAVGHSSRDTYKMLHQKKVAMENKSFAIGSRIEHPRALIDEMQYGDFRSDIRLGSASYAMTYNNKKTNRGVFSFCMCPGGEIVNASSIYKSSLVNGMSYHARDLEFSNSAVVVSVTENEFGNHLFSGMEYQEILEKKTYEIIGDYGAIYQNLFDYMNNRETNNNIKSSFRMNLKSYNLNEFFPDFINENLKEAFNYWSKNKFFISKEANLIAPETRTSSPIRIIRDEYGESINVKNLFPIGEGAGYAGGIVSAAMDGIKIVDLNFSKEKE